MSHPPDRSTSQPPPQPTEVATSSLDEEILVYLQRPSLLLPFRTSLINYFSDSPHYAFPARFNATKPPALRLSDDAWAALKLRVDPLARDVLDPHRYYLVALGMSAFVSLVFYVVRPGKDLKKIQKRVGDDDTSSSSNNEYYYYLADDDDEVLYDDYFQDDEYDRKHALDDVVLAEYEYFNAVTEKKIWTWRIALFLTLVVLFGSVIFIAVLMERRNASIDGSIAGAIEEMRPRIEGEGLEVEYRSTSIAAGRDTTAATLWLGKYLRPRRVVAFRYLKYPSPRSGEKNNRKRNFFLDEYQREYFGNNNDNGRGGRTSNHRKVALEVETGFHFTLI